MSRNILAAQFKNNKRVLLAALLVLAPTLNVSYAATTTELYNQSCVTCHGAAVLGAPKTGDKAAWNARLKKGMPTLVQHVKEGYKNMPAKGLCTTCTDADLTNLIALMAK
ncbi:MAG: cytochrome c5 family protein [Aquirhabdus sp.]